MSFKILMPALFAIGGLCACVEVRNKNEGQESQLPKSIQLVDLPSVQIHEPMYVYDGKILNLQDLELEIKLNEVSKKIVKHDFVFSIDKLIITDGGSLYTLGNNVRIHVQSIDCESCLISTFPEGQNANPGVNGRAGGHLLIDIKEGVGFIKIVMRGEAGGQGLPGASPDDSMRGKEGTHCSIGGEPDLKTLDEHLAAVITGGKGEKGRNGKPGARGGDSGTLELKISANSDFTFSIDRQPGVGGAGGVGGRGGEGGGEGNPECNRRAFKNQIEARQGEQGDVGRVGDSGANQIYCLNQQNIIHCL